MEHKEINNKDIKVESTTQDGEVISPTFGAGGLARQGSVTKYNCLCSPTTHQGSFRCRLHRAPSLPRTKSIDSPASEGSLSKVSPSTNVPTQNNAQ
ncbi:hypothetical protein ACJIZ3_010346 [Penstemon smallii]|uniref:Uncharacterized protein n=1 Tax=Penstemon smallii TaxID=265156 RepID=A0ABD3TF30_9LAMI